MIWRMILLYFSILLPPKKQQGSPNNPGIPACVLSMTAAAAAAVSAAAATVRAADASGTLFLFYKNVSGRCTYDETDHSRCDHIDHTECSFGFTFSRLRQLSFRR